LLLRYAYEEIQDAKGHDFALPVQWFLHFLPPNRRALSSAIRTALRLLQRQRQISLKQNVHR
jgi:hypothetical protein